MVTDGQTSIVILTAPTKIQAIITHFHNPPNQIQSDLFIWTPPIALVIL